LFTLPFDFYIFLSIFTAMGSDNESKTVPFFNRPLFKIIVGLIFLSGVIMYIANLHSEVASVNGMNTSLRATITRLEAEAKTVKKEKLELVAEKALLQNEVDSHRTATHQSTVQLADVETDLNHEKDLRKQDALNFQEAKAKLTKERDDALLDLAKCKKGDQIKGPNSIPTASRKP
jgi:multidrug resistance efflux pump